MNPRKLAPLVLPVVIWVLLWGDLSVANVASGIVVAVVLWLLFPPLHRGEPRAAVVRPMAIARFGGHFAWSFLVANVEVAREVLRPRSRSRIRTAIVAIPVRGCSEGLLTTVANATTLTPGTMSVEASLDPPQLYVHVLSLQDASQVYADVARFNELVVRAFGSREQIAALDEPPGEPVPLAEGAADVEEDGR